MNLVGDSKEAMDVDGRGRVRVSDLRSSCGNSVEEVFPNTLEV